MTTELQEYVRAIEAWQAARRAWNEFVEVKHDGEHLTPEDAAVYERLVRAISDAVATIDKLGFATVASIYRETLLTLALKGEALAQRALDSAAEYVTGDRWSNGDKILAMNAVVDAAVQWREKTRVDESALKSPGPWSAEQMFAAGVAAGERIKAKMQLVFAIDAYLGNKL